MTLNQAAYYIAGTLNRPEDDVFVAEIKFAIKYYRSKLLRDDFHRNGIDKSSVQSFVVPLINVDKSLTHLIEFDCDIKRTTDKVPISIKTKTNSPFLFVGGVGAISTNVAVPIYADTVNDRLVFAYTPTLTTSEPIHFSGSYRIIP